jgi:hypothetical protein
MSKICLSAGLALAALTALHADVVETKDGSRLVGKLIKIDAGKVYFTTSYAGDLTLKQSEVVAIETDHPVSVRLDSGTRIAGAISSPNGALQVAGPDGTITTSIPKVAATWPVGDMDPAIAALQRHWKFEAMVDVNGTTGNKSQLATDFGFGSKLVGPQDELDLYTAYNRQVSEGVKTADQFKAGLDYTSTLGDGTSWFLRDVGGFDRIMDIRFFETVAAGIGHDLIKNKIDLLTARAGLAYRYDGYSVATIPAVNSAAADFELNHDLKTANWELVDKLNFVPAFSDFSDYVVNQDSYFQIPLKNPAWKLRFGLANNLNNRPPPGIKKLDTTYYTRLILDWGK